MEALAKRFVSVASLAELKAVIALEKDILPLGGGSNLLITKDIQQLVVKIDLRGIVVEERPDDYVLVTVAAGENWHDFVSWCISQEYGGLENLSLIPGNVGSAPIQNIGAYGVELKDTLDHLNAVEIASGNSQTFSREDCCFGYRDSIFKNSLKGQYIISHVGFKLRKRNHRLTTSYGTLSDSLSAIQQPTLQDVSKAIIAIRKSKLPDPDILGNAGSFFKNPVIGKDHFAELQQSHSDIPHYVVSEDGVKIPAGWLIEQAGFKGKRYGDAGVHKNQALVLVNYNRASGSEILALAEKIQTAVKTTFGINLEKEVTVH